MKQLKKFLEKDGFDYSKLIKKIVIALLFVVIFIILLATGQILFLLQIFGWLESQVRALTGLDTLIVKGIATLLMALILILPIGGFIFSFFPFPQKNKKSKRLIVLTIFALLCFASYFSSKNVFFDSATGSPLKYYSISPTGEYKFYSSNGFDPITGDKLQPISKEIVVKYINLNSKEKAVTISDNLGSATRSNGSKSLLGAANYANSYPVKFVNKTGMKIFLCIGTNLDQTGPFLIKLIPAGESAVISLMEGRHIFGYMDTSGICYGWLDDNGWLDGRGEILEETGPRRSLSDDISNKPKEFIYFMVTINSQDYTMYRTFYLNVLPDDDMSINLRKNHVTNN